MWGHSSRISGYLSVGLAVAAQAQLFSFAGRASAQTTRFEEINLGFTAGSWGDFNLHLPADGRQIAGTAGMNAHQAMRLIPGDGSILIPMGPSLTGQSFGNGISADGRYIVGGIDLPDRRAPMRWDNAGVQTLGDLPGSASAASADGAVVVGYAWDDVRPEAMRWTQATGLVKIGPLWSFATGVSGDGQVVIGKYEQASQDHAFRWTAATGWVPLGTTSGDARAITPDGVTIVGALGGAQAYRWTVAGGFQALGDLPGGAFNSAANGISGIL